MPKPSVLIIDDEPVVRTAVQTALKREEYDLIYAENGEEGLSLALNHLPTVIILDIRMPGMGGIEFLAKLKLSPSDPYSVIVLSGTHGGIDDVNVNPRDPRSGPHTGLRRTGFPATFSTATCSLVSKRTNWESN